MILHPSHQDRLRDANGSHLHRGLLADCHRGRVDDHAQAGFHSIHARIFTQPVDYAGSGQ